MPSMSFVRYGRTQQLRVADAEDLRHVLHLDEAIWVCTSAPTASLRCDPTFLDHVAGTTGTRIDAEDLRVALAWMLDHFEIREGITTGSSTLVIDRVNRVSPQGEQVIAAAEKMLAMLEVTGETITLEQVRQVKHRLEQTPVSEAGVVLPAAGSQEVRKFLQDVITVEGGASHPSGQVGVGGAQLNAFHQHVVAYLAWYEQGQIEAGPERDHLFPLGDTTESANTLVQRLAPRIEAYFEACRCLRYYTHWEDTQRLQLPDLAAVAAGTTSLQGALISRPSTDMALLLDDSVNPSDAADLARLRTEVLEPLFHGPAETLDATLWEKVRAAFQPFDAWEKARPDGVGDKLTVERMAAYRDGDFTATVLDLVSRSQHTAIRMEDVRLVEKLLLYQRHMIGLVNNFVSFPHLYDPEDRAMFEVGTLVADGRRFNMAVQVTDRKTHMQLANFSRLFVMYLQLDRPGVQTPLEVAVPVTAGGQGNLVVGKRGLFVDTAGLHWEARIVSIVENPISIREAMTAPFRRIGSLVGGKIDQFTGSAEKRLDQTTQSAMTDVEKNLAAETPAATPPPSAERRVMLVGGVLAGGGVALAALGSAAAFVTKTIGSMQAPQLIIAVVSALAAVLLPSAVLAMLKLRQRDLSAVLEGAGWAINARMRLTRAQSRQFTQRPLPPVRQTYPWRWILCGLLSVALVVGAVLAYRAWGEGTEEEPVAEVLQETPVVDEEGAGK